jgi:hypothetical protein
LAYAGAAESVVTELGQKGPFGLMCSRDCIRTLGAMEKDSLALATRLLVKAQGTTFHAEAAALTAKAYRLLAEALNSYDDSTASTGTGRKRERRHLRDRRTGSAPTVPSTPDPVSATYGVHVLRGNWIDLPIRSRVDLMI